MNFATQSQADAFVAHMARTFRARVIRKSMAIEMQMIGAIFGVLRVAGIDVPSPEDFERFATTLGPLVYLPDGLSPDATIEVVTHEMQHVQQFWRGGLHLPGGPGMAWLYLVEPEARVRYECDAYRAGLEMEYARTRTLRTLESMAQPLEGGYALGDGDVQLGRDLLEVAATSVQAGMVSTEAGREAIAWLRANAPELLS